MLYFFQRSCSGLLFPQFQFVRVQVKVHSSDAQCCPRWIFFTGVTMLRDQDDFYALRWLWVLFLSVACGCFCMSSSCYSRLVAWMYALGYPMWFSSRTVQDPLWKTMCDLELISEAPQRQKSHLASQRAAIWSNYVSVFMCFVAQLYVSIPVTHVQIFL